MNSRLRKEYKHCKHLCLSKEMDFISLLKHFETKNKHAGHYPAPLPRPHISSLSGVKRHCFSQESEALCYLWINRKIPHVTVWLVGAPCRAPSWGFLWHVRWWVDEILSPSQYSGGLVQTWHDWPRAPTRLDNRNIQQFISLRLNSFVFYITTFFFP